jgi:hypothetical protein
VITTAAMDEAGKSAWCREHGIFPPSSTSGVPTPQRPWPSPRGPASPQATRADKKRIKALERELHRKEKAWPKPLPSWFCQKSRGDLQQGRGRMIGLEDRQALARDVHAAHAAGRV